MKCGARVALGVAGGYFLGRTKKMKLALMLGGMVAGRQAGGTQLLAKGGELLRSSPELQRLGDQVRGRLMQAGKDAAVAVAARQVESLTDRIGSRVESLGDLPRGLKDLPGNADGDSGGAESDEQQQPKRRTARRSTSGTRSSSGSSSGSSSTSSSASSSAKRGGRTSTTRRSGAKAGARTRRGSDE